MSRTVVKAASVFGGVQVINILCAAVRAKLFAIFAGPSAVGLLAIYTQAIAAITALTQLNFNQSSIRDISSAPESRQPLMVGVTRRWALWLGLLGVATTLLLSPLLSLWSFGTLSYAPAFCLLSVTLLLSAYSGAEQAVLQGLRRLKALAKASTSGYIIATVVAVPMIWLWGIDAVIPVILAIFIAQALALWISRRRTSLPSITPTHPECFAIGSKFIKLGAYMTASSFITLALTYAFSAYLSERHSDAAVGVYQAGYTLVNAYIGLIFNAIVMEYYPRLSKNIANPRRSSILVSHEISIALWVLIPALCTFIAIDDLLVRLLYSESFSPIYPYVTIAAIGVIFRAFSWCIAFVILAKGDGVCFAATEAVSGIIFLVLNIVLYEHMSYEGLGIAYILWYASYSLIVWGVYRLRYRMRLGKGIAALLILSLLIVAAAAAAKIYASYIFAVGLALATIYPAVRKLRR